MKKISAFLLMAILVSACAWNSRPSKKLTTLKVAYQDVTVKYFNKVSIMGNIDVEYQQGDRNFVRFEGSRKILKHYGIEVKNGTLRIECRNRHLGFDDDDNAKIIVGSQDLIEVALAGSGSFTSHGKVDTDRLELKMAGSGDININDVICDAVKANIAGSGDIELRNVTTGKADFAIAGSGDIAAHFAQCRKITNSIAGSGDIELSGQAGSCEQKIAGSGSVDTNKLSLRKSTSNP